MVTDIPTTDQAIYFLVDSFKKGLHRAQPELDGAKVIPIVADDIEQVVKEVLEGILNVKLNAKQKSEKYSY